MKKVTAAASIAILMLLLVLGYKYGNSENFSLFIAVGLALILFLSYFYFESSEMGTKEIALIATLSAFAGASRVLFAPFPQIKPTTFLVALSGYVFGPYPGFLVGSTAAFISNIFLGQGPWTPWQMLAWGIVGAVTGIAGRRVKGAKGRMPVEKFAALCFVYGFLFDWIMNLWHVVGFVRPITLKSIALAYATGLTFDIMHAAGNFVFAVIFYDNLYKVLQRFKRRLEVTYIEYKS